MDFYNIIKYKHDYFTKFAKSKHYKFYIDKYWCGYISKENLEIIHLYFKDEFTIVNDSVVLRLGNNNILIQNNIPVEKSYHFKLYSDFFVKFLNKLVEEKKIVAKGEAMLTVAIQEKIPICVVDRSLLAFLGISAKGIHVNGYVIKDNQKYVWLSKRANTTIEANKYDNLVGGAISYGYEVLDTLQKESLEEANINKDLSSQAVFSKSLSYIVEKNQGIRNDIVYIFDLQLPIDYTPMVNDGEVEKFFLVSLAELKEYLINWDSFKFNSWLVAAYFLNNNYNNISAEEKQALNIMYNDLNNSDIINKV